MKKHHRIMIGFHFDHLSFVEVQLEHVESEIDQILLPHLPSVELLVTIPGIQKYAAAVILAEIGDDMSCFGGEAQIAAWAGLCPGNNESAGKKKSSRIAKGNKSLKAVLCQAAWAASKSKGTRLAAFFYRIQKRRGQKKATVATAHLILRMIYRMLKENQPYRESGWDYLTSSTSSVDYWIKKIEAQGFTVKLNLQKPLKYISFFLNSHNLTEGGSFCAFWRLIFSYKKKIFFTKETAF